jgi:hypothetical protein
MAWLRICANRRQTESAWRKRVGYALAAGVIVLLLSRMSQAADLNGEFEIYGQGGKTCGRYTDLYPIRRNDAPPLFASTNYFEFIEWILGYLSAYNAQTDDIYSILGTSDSSAIGAWLYSYCQSHPLENVHSAMRPLIDALYPKRILKH